MIELIDFDYCRKVLGIDEEDESFVQLLIIFASFELERYADRCFGEREIKDFYNGGYERRELTLKQYPLKSVEKLTVRRNDVDYEISPSFYQVDSSGTFGEMERPGVIRLNEGYLFPSGRNCVQVEYTAGYKADEVPEDLKMAAVEMVGWQLKRIRARQIGVLGLVNEKRGKERAILEGGMPGHVREILGRYRRKSW